MVHVYVIVHIYDVIVISDNGDHEGSRTLREPKTLNLRTLSLDPMPRHGL